MLNIDITKLFVYNPKEGEIIKPALIVYKKKPFIFKAVVFGNGYVNMPKKYRYYLYINLWFIELNFNWTK